MSSVVTLIPYKVLPNDDLEEDYSQKHIQLGIGQQILGRGDFLSISDKRVSRSQATLTVEPEDDKKKITLKRLGMNAMFVVRNDGQWIPLEKEQELELEDGDCFSMCVREFMFRIKIEENNAKPQSQPAATEEDSQIHAKKANDVKPQIPEQQEPKQAEPQEGWFTKKKKEPVKTHDMEVENKPNVQEQEENNKQNANNNQEQNSQDSDAKKNKRKITEEESDEEEYVEKVQKQIEKHQSTEDVSKTKKQKTVQAEVEDDEALARRLQKELEEEEKGQKPKNNKPNKKKPVEEDDAALAKRLQKELEQEEEEQLKKDAKLAKALAKGHKGKGKKLTYESGRPRRMCTLKKTKYEDDQVWSSEESWDGEPEDEEGSGSDEEKDWNSQDSGSDEGASASGSDGEYKAAKKKKKQKPMCQYGADCYRKNADHLKAFRHPKK